MVQVIIGKKGSGKTKMLIEMVNKAAAETKGNVVCIEQDMILRHMFPLIPIPPKTAAGWLLCFYDKVAALSDYFGENKWKKRADDMQR